MLVKRELIIHDQGIEYRMGGKLRFTLSWKKIKKIGVSTSDVLTDVIEIQKKSGDSPYINFPYIHSSEREKAFIKMTEYAVKYKIEIDDQYNYLKSYVPPGERIKSLINKRGSR
jgi:hypothetical protein